MKGKKKYHGTVSWPSDGGWSSQNVKSCARTSWRKKTMLGTYSICRGAKKKSHAIAISFFGGMENMLPQEVEDGTGSVFV